ncbi:MAG: hypoxanthine phosphoribosyltransferase [Kiritimatiellae bacterium]|nr:hypoxanthine phosphoribosyltransferase [Kiritimatiellia bacterium]
MRPHHIQRVLFPAEAIARRVAELAGEIAQTTPGPELCVIGILRGSFVFLADLIRCFHHHRLRPRLDFTLLQSYGGQTCSSGEIRVLRDFDLDVRGRDTLIVDDILDTGRTLAFAAGRARERGAARVRTCVLLDKPARRVVPIRADFVAFTCPDEFVVGYGLDYDSLYRDLPWIAAVTFTDDMSPADRARVGTQPESQR